MVDAMGRILYRDECCGTCEHHCFDWGPEEWICSNKKSEFYSDETYYGFCCEDWEARR